jgi:hypothetical protein
LSSLAPPNNFAMSVTYLNKRFILAAMPWGVVVELAGHINKG